MAREPASDVIVGPEVTAGGRGRGPPMSRHRRHLSLVAGITRGQRSRLVERGVTTKVELGALRLPVVPRLDGIGDGALIRIREQARVQEQARREGCRIHELITPVEPDKGLAALPEPSDGDVFFDLEGDALSMAPWRAGSSIQASTSTTAAPTRPPPSST